MEEGWLGYIFAGFFFFSAFWFWKNPWNAFDDIDGWDDVTDDNIQHFRQTRVLWALAQLIFSFLIYYNAEAMTTKFGEVFFDPFAGSRAATIEEYTCEDVERFLKKTELANVFGRKFKVLVVTEIVEIGRTESSIECNATSMLSSGSDVTITAKIESIDGQFFLRASVDN